MDKNEIARQCAVEMLSNDSASRTLGIEVEVTQPGAAVARMRIREDMVNGLGVCHGGLIFTLADTAFAFACNGYNLQTVAASGQIDFLRPGALGDELVATASEDHRGRRRGFYVVKVENQRAETVALFHGRSATTGEPIVGT